MRLPTLCALAVVALAASCGDDEDDLLTGSGAPTAVTTASVTDTRVSPARVAFSLRDAESDPAAVVVSYFEPGSAAPRTATLVGSPPLSALATSFTGVQHVVEWDFDADLGITSFQTGYQVRVAVVSGVQSVASAATVTDVSLGNDAPVVQVLSPFTTPLAGVVPLDFRLSDTTGDLVDVTVEYDVLGDVPDAGFRTARPAGLAPQAPTPAVALAGVRAPSAGALLSFSWDSVFQLGGQDVEAVLRIRASDDLLAGASALSPVVRVDNNATAVAAAIGLTEARESPARLAFSLRDPEGDPQRVALSFVRPGSAAFEPLTLAQPDPLDGLAASASGVAHERLWDFAADLGSTSYVEGLVLRVEVLEGAQAVHAASATSVAVGNDAPELLDVVAVPAGEVTGDVDVTFRVADSSDDLVRVRVEYDVLGDSPDAGFRPARPAGLPPGDPTPAFAFTDLPADRTGVDVDFAWDAVADEGARDFEAVLRFQAEDDLVAGNSLAAPIVRVDNNRAPRTELDAAALAARGDGVRGVPVSFDVFDDEGDAVDLFVQWRLASGAFPALPADVDDLRAALADPRERARLQVAREYPLALSGRAQRLPAAQDPDGRRARLPELAPGGLAALAGALEGARLEVLGRAGAPRVLAGVPLSSPAAVAAVDGGPTLLVLDEPAPGAWRLSEVDRGEPGVARELASGADGSPRALALARGELGRALVAAGDGSTWTLLAVSLTDGAVSTLLPRVHAPVSGAVTGLAAVDPATAVLTVGDALVRANADPAGILDAQVLASGLAGAAGVVVDPRDAGRALVALRGDASAAGGVVAVDLGTLDRALVAPVPARAIAVSPRGTELFLVTDADPGDGEQELVRLALGLPAAAPAPVAAGLPAGPAALAAGADGLLAVALPGADELRVAGGVEQVRAVESFDPAKLAVAVDRPFEPPLAPGARWRLTRPLAAGPAPAGGARRTLVWDSSEVGRDADVVLRALALDTDLGAATESQPLALRAPLSVAPVPADAGGALRPAALVAADLDGDGAPDLAFLDLAAGELLVLLQGADGRHAPAHRAALPGVPRDLLAADADGDGLTDLVYATSTELGVVASQGGGAFSAPAPLGPGADALAAGDVDRDGRLDLVAADGAAGAASFRFGAAGGLPGATDLELTGLAGAGAVALADLTGSGELDLLVGRGDGAVAVFLQGPPRVFGPAPFDVLPAPVGAAASSLATGDLDGDGDPDLAVAHAAAGAIALHELVAPGAFAPVPALIGDPATTPGPARLALADLDGDGGRDLAVALAVAGGPGAAVFLQRADGSFPSIPDLGLFGPADAVVAAGLAARDLSGDGRTDLAVARDGGVDVFLQAAPGDFAAPPEGVPARSTPSRVRFAVAADLDGDGDLDLAFANSSEDRVTLALQTAPATFEPDPRGPVGDGLLDATSSLAAGDLDGDGAVDLAAALPGKSCVALLLQRGGGLAFDPLTGNLGAGQLLRPRGVAVADLDGDGDHDVVAASTGSHELALFPQVAPGAFAAAPQSLLGGPGQTYQPERVLAADLDGDGDVDLAAACSGHPVDGGFSGVAVLLATAGGPATFPSVTLGPLGPAGGLRDVAAADLDLDGDLDLVGAAEGDGALLLWLQTSPGAFAPALPVRDPAGPVRPEAVRAADVDGDGDEDLVALDGAGERLLVLELVGPATLRVARRLDLAGLPGAGAPLAVAAADLDADGDLDLAVAGSLGSVHALFFGGR